MRDDGQGSKTAKGYWRVRITVEDEYGRRKQKGFESKTLLAAQNKARRYEFEHGRVYVADIMVGTLKHAFAHCDRVLWQSTGEKNRIDMHTYQGKWESKIGDSRVDQIDAPLLTRVAAELGKDRSASYLAKLRRCIRQALGCAISDLGWIQVNPADGMRTPKAGGKKPVYDPITQKEYDRMLGLADPRCRLLIRLVGECGMRPIEAVRVRSSDLHSVADRWLVGIPKSKTAAGVRAVPVADSLMRLIEARTDEDWEGVTDPAEHLRKWWREKSKTRFYDLRGWCADNWRRRNIPEQVRSYLLGHVSPKFTQTVYEKLLGTDVLSAFDDADRLKQKGGSKVGKKKAEGRKATG